MDYFKEVQGGLLFSRRGEQVWIRPWGKNSLRVQATKNAAFSSEDWALSLPVAECSPVIRYTEDGAELENGAIRVTVSPFGKLSFYHGDTLLLKEYYRTWEFRSPRSNRPPGSIGSRAATITALPSFLKRIRRKKSSVWASISMVTWIKRAAGWS